MLMHTYCKIILFMHSVTLTQTEKGYAPPIEHIAVPKRIATEMGVYYLCLIFTSYMYI